MINAPMRFTTTKEHGPVNFGMGAMSKSSVKRINELRTFEKSITKTSPEGSSIETYRIELTDETKKALSIPAGALLNCSGRRPRCC